MSFAKIFRIERFLAQADGSMVAEIPCPRLYAR